MKNLFGGAKKEEEPVTPEQTEVEVQEIKPGGQTQELPELNIPDSVFEEEPPKVNPELTIQDTQEYIGILLRDLEATKQENAQLKIPKKEGRNPWKAVTILLLVLILVAVFWFVARFNPFGSKPVINNQPSATPVLSPTEAAQPQATTRFTIVDLKTYVEQLPASATEPFQVSVETWFGYEYLVLSDQKIKIYYRNEFDLEDDGRRRVLLDNGNSLAEFNWEYDLTGPVERLVPKYGLYSADTEYQLLFLDYSEEYPDFPETMHFIGAGNLYDYGTIHTAARLKELFQLEYSEQAGNMDTAENHMKLTFQTVPYTYRISKEAYIDAVYYEENNIQLEQHFSLQFSEAGITFRTAVSVGENEFLGELTGTITKNQLEFGFSNMRFGAYVEADQEDYGSDGVIDPKPYPLNEYIIMNGKNKERYLIGISDEIIPSVINWDNWVEDADKPGIYQYVEDNRVVSIRGIDVSKYQGEIDWKKVKADGVEFAIIRLGYRGMGQGTLETDPYFKENIKGANEAGVKVGVYFFSQAITEEEALQEADMVLEMIADYQVDYPVIIDTEEVTTYEARANILTREKRTDYCITFCERIREAGYTPMIYANTRYMIMGLELERLVDYDKWFAYYGSNHSFPYEFHMFQYSDTGTVDGIDGPVDLDVSFVDYANPELKE